MKAQKGAVQGLDTFVDALVEEKGLGNLDKEVLEQLKNDLGERVENRVNATILSKIPPAELENFEKLLAGGDEKELRSFCMKNIPDLDQVIAAELLSFRQTYLGA